MDDDEDEGDLFDLSGIDGEGDVDLDNFSLGFGELFDDEDYELDGGQGLGDVSNLFAEEEALAAARRSSGGKKDGEKDSDGFGDLDDLDDDNDDDDDGLGGGRRKSGNGKKDQRGKKR